MESMGTVRRNTLVALAALAMVVASGAITPMTAQAAQEAEAGKTTQEVQSSGTDRFEIHVQGADLRGVLQLLSTQGKKNIVATKEVTGEVTADLYGVNFEEALEAVVRSTGYVYEQKDNFVYVYTPEQYQAVKDAQRKMDRLVYHLAYLTASDAEALITPALSRDGQVALTPEAITGIKTSSTEAGGDDYATNDVLVVYDYEENIKRIKAILEELDIRPQQVLIEATILRATLTENNDLGIDFSSLGTLDFSALDTRLNWDNAVSGSVPAGGLTLGITMNQVEVFIRALESVSDVTVMANPKLLVVNKQRGEIMIGNRDGYLTTTITETVATQTVQFLETGTRLVVRPYIGKNGWIRMDIHPEDSSGSVEIVGTAALPSETTTEVTSNVMVRDGHTIVIGGLFRERTSIGRSQVPFLGNIPYLGVLFRSTSDETDREEVIILVTPHIVQPDVDEPVFEQMKNDAERFRIGARKGLQWFGRERLAQQHMRWAKKALSSGDRAKALWNVDMALSLKPRMEEAIRTKERLTESAYWSDESRLSSIKYVIPWMVMQELGRPLEEIIPPAKPRNARDIPEDVQEALGIGQRYEAPLPGPAPAPRAVEPEQTAPTENPENPNGDGDLVAPEPREQAQADPVEPSEAEPSDDGELEAFKAGAPASSGDGPHEAFDDKPIFPVDDLAPEAAEAPSGQPEEAQLIEVADAQAA